MSWTTPKTWSVDELVTASMLNAELRDNLNALKAPPTAQRVLDQAANYTTTSTSFVDVDSVVLSLTVTSRGGDLMVHYHGSVLNTSNLLTMLDITLDGVRVGTEAGLIVVKGSHEALASFTRLLTGVAAGVHTIRLQWRVDVGTGVLLAGAETVLIHPQFWVREVS